MINATASNMMAIDARPSDLARFVDGSSRPRSSSFNCPSPPSTADASSAAAEATLSLLDPVEPGPDLSARLTGTVSNRHPDPPAWPIYEAHRDRLIDLVRDLDDGARAQPVPLTAGWSVAEVVAHVCGLNADVASGLRVGLGSAERTRHQVTTRAESSIEEVCEEWLSHAEAMRAAFEDDPFFGHRLTADLTIHLHDVSHGLGLRVDRNDVATRCASHTYGSVVTDLLLERTGVSLRVEMTDGATFEPTGHRGPTDLVVRVTPFDFLRTATGRRSEAEAERLDWDGDPTAALAHISPYGPLRDTDAGF